MRKLSSFFMMAMLFALAMSCEQAAVEPKYQVSDEVMAKLNQLGFNTDNFEARQFGDKVIVENDIRIDLDRLEEMTVAKQIPESEHFSTSKIVDTDKYSTIKVFVDDSFGAQKSKYINAARIAVKRYQDENLTLKFVLENDQGSQSNTSGYRITITASPAEYYEEGILGSAGFPTSGGAPHNEIEMTKEYYNNVQNINGLATTMAHEIGHCIGFRHTDYAFRWTSCGWFNGPWSEGSGNAVHISGTPSNSSGDLNSWMMACGSPEGDRPFTDYDKKALDELY